MEVEKDRTSILIIKSLEALIEQVNISNISDSEKEIARLLLNKMKILFCNRLKVLGNNREKIFNLQCRMTDIIADMNNVVCGKTDILDYAEDLNNKIHDQELGHLVSKQRYLKYKLG